MAEAAKPSIQGKKKTQAANPLDAAGKWNCSMEAQGGETRLVGDPQWLVALAREVHPLMKILESLLVEVVAAHQCQEEHVVGIGMVRQKVTAALS